MYGQFNENKVEYMQQNYKAAFDGISVTASCGIDGMETRIYFKARNLNTRIGGDGYLQFDEKETIALKTILNEIADAFGIEQRSGKV